MSTILVCSTPLHGHVTPMLAAARVLQEHGHRVVVLTGTRFEPRVVAAGLEFAPLGSVADFDETDPSTFAPDRPLRGLALSRWQVERTFVEPVADQARAVQTVLDATPVDGVLADCLFGGVLPLLARPRASRPFVFGLGIGPLAQLSRDVAPSNSGLGPSSSTFGRIRNVTMNALVTQVLFRSTQRLAQAKLAEVGAPALDGPVLDLSARFDRLLQLGPAEFEYPRSDLRPNTTFIGPFPPAASGRSGPGETALPAWWTDLDPNRPLVHVTQGTLDNHDFTKLVRPALDGLAAEPVEVVVSTGGRPVSGLGPLPANAHAAEYLPYGQLLPRTAVMVTNGGYGGTLLALRHGVPLVVAGAAEDKPEVAARVAHFGVGVDLRTGRPSPSQVRDAVVRVLGDGAVADRARAMGEAIARTDAPRALLEAVTSELASV
ncbi:glycosyltransferase, MGT family [Quadrisphaera granulorum]|uniref:MGT family glycosyltransferase n=1 Tax=Quadrisphaera granulorum TaxID=317664 RepID=A0A315ZLU9_9ACTN|nr:glycosyltransferase [Quadrisphaera granulorum]PWJ46496.1 MGT family glycosyltransferase [Quadrisphaera granulorum]SZE99054.1 glycosyltransferase, MGT family [Quadrisphaera granulorum]